MHKRKSIINIPLLIGAALSIAIHVAAFYGRGLSSPPVPQYETGKTVVQLTLMPSIARQVAAPEPEPQEEPAEQPIEPQVEQVPLPALPSELQPQEHPQPDTESASLESPEIDASLITEKGVSGVAQASSTIHPIYPRISRRRGEAGRVTLSIQVLPSGKAGTIIVLHSSGYHRLDEAAITAAEKSGFIPAKKLGHAVDSSIELSFTFELTDD
jgi:protein TonB